jgi:plasmid maintenance system antidote protein VapI
MQKIDRNKAAIVLKGAMVMRGRKQDEVAQAVGITRQDLNAFLNRRIDLMPDVIEKLVREIGLEKMWPVLSGGAEMDRSEAIKK